MEGSDSNVTFVVFGFLGLGGVGSCIVESDMVFLFVMVGVCGGDNE